MNHQTLSTLDQALTLLSHREHSSKELSRKLQNRNHSQEEIQATIDKLVEMDYLNDERFAASFTRSKINKPLGARRIQQELIQKGISSELAKRTIEEHNADWFELAKHLKEKKFGTGISTDFKEKAKQSRYLQYRGFEFEQIKYALSASDDLF
ncbi:recombination regulator RecX [Marinomonas transparens]|uniref:Regulatory protein RecX n=1 Tax=Marinomonas transparens TaxID=2795388 RepID=A0A934N3I8_9GAMM|nr:recombination regulator RecX [Marinomonas transparens]MBJ7539737.1 recombination regulator RecX [Marinomonas transparens]